MKPNGRKNMERVKALLVVWVVVCLLDSRSTYGQPSIPKDEIPSDMPAKVREQVEKLYASDPRARGEAATRLGNLGNRAAEAIPFLISMLGDNTPIPGYFSHGPPPSVGYLASDGLVCLGKPAVEPLIAALKDEHRTLRANAVRALAYQHDPRTVGPLIDALADDEREIRLTAAYGLSHYQEARLVEPWIKALKDEYVEVRKYASGSLGWLGDRRAVEPLIAALTDGDSWVREDAVESLGQIGDPRAIEPLKAMLEALTKADHEEWSRYIRRTVDKRDPRGESFDE